MEVVPSDICSAECVPIQAFVDLKPWLPSTHNGGGPVLIRHDWVFPERSGRGMQCGGPAIIHIWASKPQHCSGFTSGSSDALRSQQHLEIVMLWLLHCRPDFDLKNTILYRNGMNLGRFWHFLCGKRNHVMIQKSLNKPGKKVKSTRTVHGQK